MRAKTEEVRLGVPVWIAPLVAPALDLSVLGLLLGLRHLVLAGDTAAQLRPARRLLVFASLATLVLDVAGPVSVGPYGKAAFDAVRPLLGVGAARSRALVDGPRGRSKVVDVHTHRTRATTADARSPSSVDRTR